MVEVEDREAERLRRVAGRAGDRGRQHVVELATVEQAGQWVAPRTPLVVLEHARVVERERGVVGEGLELPARAVVEPDSRRLSTI